MLFFRNQKTFQRAKIENDPFMNTEPCVLLQMAVTVASTSAGGENTKTRMTNRNAEKNDGKKYRPGGSTFKQQQLAAWQPTQTVHCIVPTFLIIGVLCVAIGVVLLITSSQIKEKVVDYTDCLNAYNESCASVIDNITLSCTCVVPFDLTEDFTGQVYMYYGLLNFHQNHRRYVKSRNDAQLLGKPADKSALCDPFENDGNRSFAPCGAVANSKFNDTILLFNSSGNSISLTSTGIAWSFDKSRKFKNPEAAKGCMSSNITCLASAFSGSTQPPHWRQPVYALDLNQADNNGFENEDLIVWMRTAALPDFRKLYRKITSVAPYEDGLPKGNYSLRIAYNYPVKLFNGSKRVILSTTNWLGGRNKFLGIVYITVGACTILFALTLLVVHWKYGKTLAELADVKRQ